MTDWAFELDALEQQMFDEYTSKKPCVVAGEDMPYTVWLDVGVQHFTMSDYRESPDHADWFRAMLAKALASIVRDALGRAESEREPPGFWRER